MILRTLVLAALAAALAAPPATAQPTKPRVAILVYDGVQVIDHAIPFEVFGQFALNEVYTVAKEPGGVTTFMGMRILPNHTFADAPEPDVLVLPGGDAGEAVRDPETAAWIRRTAAEADHVLTICTGTFFLVGTDLLDGARITTWYDRQAELARAVPSATVVADSIVVESGKLVTAAGLGVEGSLRVLERLHGTGWAEVVRLNMEHEPVPPSHHVPRVELADLNLPDGIYGAFPWRAADLERFEGDRDRWAMTWRFHSEASADSLRDRIVAAVADPDGWALVDESRGPDRWESTWSLTGRDGEPWRGEVALSTAGNARTLDVRVRGASADEGPSPGSVADPCESTDPAWSPDGARIVFASNCDGGNLDLFIMDADGANVSRLTRTPGHEHTPTFSPDGSRLAYALHVEGEDSEIWTMAPDGSGARRLTDNASTDWSPSWSPDGRRIAFESSLDENADVRVVDVETGAETRLTDDPAHDLDPAWSPDGATIAFQSDRGGRYAIWTVPAGGGEARRLVGLPGHVAGPSWSPDGGRLVVAHLGDGRDGDLKIAHVDGVEPTPLTSGSRSDFAPAWSPDGRRVAFIARSESGAWDVWTIPADGGDPTRLTFGGEPVP